jgi:hypothetical protein
MPRDLLLEDLAAEVESNSSRPGDSINRENNDSADNEKIRHAAEGHHKQIDKDDKEVGEWEEEEEEEEEGMKDRKMEEEEEERKKNRKVEVGKTLSKKRIWNWFLSGQMSSKQALATK